MAKQKNNIIMHRRRGMVGKQGNHTPGVACSAGEHVIVEWSMCFVYQININLYRGAIFLNAFCSHEIFAV